MECVDFFMELDNEYLAPEANLKIEKHALQCPECALLLFHWFINRLIEMQDSRKLVQQDERLQQKILNGILANTSKKQ